MDAMIRADDHKAALQEAGRSPQRVPALAGPRLVSACWMLFMLLAFHWAVPLGQPAGPSSMALAADGGNGLAASERTDEPAVQLRLLAISGLTEVRLYAGKRDHSADNQSPFGLTAATPGHDEPGATLQWAAGGNALSLMARAHAYEARGPPLPA